MGLLCHHRSTPPLPVLAALVLLLSAAAFSLLQFGSPSRAAAVQEIIDGRTRMELLGGRGLDGNRLRRALRGLGSSPPTCRSKCGQCSPCRPVHVPFHPGFGVPLEYYPEAWRCKCGSKLFMP